MKNHFGEFDESVLKALRDAYNPDANSFAESCDESFDFVQCQRSDGTIYGSRGECKQKGAKEVKPSTGGYAGPINKSHDNALKLSKQEVKKLGSQATIDYLSAWKDLSMDSFPEKARREAGERIQSAYNHLIQLNKGEGKKAPTVRSIVSGNVLQKLGLNPDAMNAKAKAKSAGKPKAKPAPKPKAKAKTKAPMTRNASDKEVLDEYRNNLKNGTWTLKQQRKSKTAKAEAEQNAINQLVREGYDARKLLKVPGFEGLKDNVNRFDYS